MYQLVGKKGNDIMNIAYVRVSTLHQNTDRQEIELEKYKIDKWFKEKVSAKDTNRPQLKAMLDYAREGDTIYIKDFSRLARSTKDLLAIVESLNNKNINLVSLKENLDTSTSTGKLMLTMIGAINEFERQNMLERQKEGIEIAKKKGKYSKKKPLPLNFEELYKQLKEGSISVAEMTRQLGNKSRTTTYKQIKEYEEEIQQKAME